MEILGIANWILKNPTVYPGKHLTSAPRTTQSCKPLEPSAQMMIIWKATSEYIHEKLLSGKVYTHAECQHQGLRRIRL